MAIVTITDHDSIDGCLELPSAFRRQRHPDRRRGVVQVPEGNIAVHLAVYGMTEALHRNLQPLRRNVFDAIACLREANVFFALNHLLHFYRGQVPLETYLRLVPLVPASKCATDDDAGAQSPDRAAPRAMPGARRRRGQRCAHAAPGRPHVDHGPRSNRGGVSGQPARRAGAARGTPWRRTAVAGDAYGVVARYCASVLGWGPRDHQGWHRSLARVYRASLPFQFLPALMPAVVKRREARRSRRRSNARCMGLPRAIRDVDGTGVMSGRVAITGIGLVTAIGLSRDETWTNLYVGPAASGR